MAPPITFAHRGARADLPENTVGAFRYALEHGARGLESDAWLSADDEVVLVHDARVWGRALAAIPWRLRIARTAASRLAGNGIPRLADLYDAFGTDYELSLDLKSSGAGERIIEVARERGDPTRVWLCSPSMRRLHQLRELASDVRLVHSTARQRLPEPLERHAADLASRGVDAINLHHSEWTKGLVELFHRFDVRAFAWDTQEVRHLRAMLEIDVDALYCDYVDRMVATVAEWATDSQHD